MSHYNVPPSSSSLPLPDQNIPARYKLQFINKVKDETFTTDLVRDEIGVPITVEIYDSYTRSRVSPDCFFSSAKVKLMVVDAEHWKNRVNWSTSEFVKNVLTDREGKRPILTGLSLIIQLKNGVGTFENIVFNDNSSWTKSGFRLAVIAKGEGEEGYLNGERVQEGVSEPFRVKDRRGKAFKKPDRLELTHSVQCIKKIGKDRASFLKNKGINTVENFLELYDKNPSKLREILCIKSESDKSWMSMVEHATQCADEFRTKYNASNNSSQPWQNCMILPHPMEGNLPLSTNGDVPAINRQHVPISDIPWMNLSNEPISTGRTVQYTGETHYGGGDSSSVNYGGGGGSDTRVPQLAPQQPPPAEELFNEAAAAFNESNWISGEVAYAIDGVVDPTGSSLATATEGPYQQYMELNDIVFGASTDSCFPDFTNPASSPEMDINAAAPAFNEPNWISGEVSYTMDGVVDPTGSSLATATEGPYQQYMELNDIVLIWGVY